MIALGRVRSQTTGERVLGFLQSPRILTPECVGYKTARYEIGVLMHPKALERLVSSSTDKMEPRTGIEPATRCLQNSSSTAELPRQKS